MLSEIDIKKEIDIYVITTGDEQRSKRVEKSLETINFNYVHSTSIDELNVLAKEYRKKSHKFRQKAIMAGEVGAFKTHAAAWEKIIQSNKPSIILEDNIHFIKDPKKLFNQDIINQIESCGLISFTDFAYKKLPYQPFLISSINEKKPLPIVCYGITPERAFNLISAMKKTAYVMPVDKWLSIPKLCGCYAFVSHITIAKRDPLLTSIANKKKGKKAKNPICVLYWAFNKIKYRY